MPLRRPLFGLAVAGLASAGLGQAPAVSAQSLPDPGVNSCVNVHILANGFISAECRTRDGGRRWSAIRHVACRGDLSNRNGVLSCRGATGTPGPYYPPDWAVEEPQSWAGAELYPLGYHFPEYGQPGYGDPAQDPRYAPGGWGEARSGQWIPIVERGPWLERVIDAGSSRRALTDSEIEAARSEFRSLIDQEGRFAADGFASGERALLDGRFDQMAARLFRERPQAPARSPAEPSAASVPTPAESPAEPIAEVELTLEEPAPEPAAATADVPHGWTPLAERADSARRDIAEGRRAASLDRRAADRLTGVLNGLVALETAYERGGLSAWERRELDRRWNELTEGLIRARD